MINKYFSFSTGYCLAILLLAVGCSPKAESRQTAADNDEEKERQPSGETLAEAEEDAYPLVFSDSSKGYAIVLKPDIGLVALNREGKMLYQVFMYDNGPDYPSDGYFRIVEKGKIGYADEETGEVSDESIEMVAKGLYSAEMGISPLVSLEAKREEAR